jgi:V8-like Glu-specific endopeptidase
MEDDKMYKKLTAVTLIVLFALVSPAMAITNGQPDGNGHPYVGLAVFDDAPGHPAWRCTGALISPTVFLTAAHCTDGAVAARVWFEPDSFPGYPFGGPKSTSIEAKEIHTNPDFCIGCAKGLPGFDTHDVGLLILSKRVTNKGFAVLPREGLVDTLAMKTEVTIVGYGVQYKDQISGPPYDRWVGRSRMFAPSLLVQSNDTISDEYMTLTANPAQEKGGVCFGDSGGPVLLSQDGKNVVLGVNSFGSNSNCAGLSYANRIDTYALQWIKGYLKP